ncbi:putative replicase polyprotein [Helleborus net necrosis virus]|uniref:Putative replicase polyprotein n=1 Tax=Helleborus net necrosis virus TaxID=592206 RepID=B9UZ23_9VIRU|nr:putative replicase polyprotein [Helleborus net necrosis virus]ACM45979.1 putative replicase polyprotein [Helleborus net necrosis virus]
MALTYRSPIENVLTTFTTTEQSSISAPAVKWYKDHEAEHFALFNYALPESAKQRLWQSGLYLSPFSALPHSHPVCKTLENYMLYTVLPTYVDNTFYFVGIKNHKLEFLKQRRKHVNLVESLNRYVTSADKFRYPNDFVIARSEEICGLKRHQRFLSNPSLKTLLPDVVAKSQKNLFFHDEIHYWDYDSLTTFLEIVKPNKLVCTMVYPPELLVGAKESLNPWCYHFEVQGDSFRFYPDGVRTEGYTQPLAGGNLLKANSIVLADGTTYGVDLLCSKFAHHLIGLSKGESKFPVDRAFGDFDAVSAEGLKKICARVQGAIPISYGTISRIYRYLRTLNKPDTQSAMAKLSQLLPEPSGYEIKFVQDFSKLVINTPVTQTMFTNNYCEAMLQSLIASAPPILGKYFSKFAALTLDKFIEELKPLTFNLKLREYKSTSNCNIDYFDFAADLEPQTVLQLLDDGFQSSRMFYGERTRALYYCNEPSFSCFDFDDSVLERTLTAYFVNAHGSESQVRFSLGRLKHFSCAFLRKCSLTAQACWGVTTEMLLRIRKRVEAILVRFYNFSFFLEPSVWFAETKRRRSVRYINATDEIPTGLFCRNDLHKSVIGELILKRQARTPAEIPIAPVNENHTEALTMLELEPDSDSDDGVALPETIQSFTCKCGCILPFFNVIGADLCILPTPDKLKGRTAGWYSKDGRPYSYNGGAHKSLGWPIWLDTFLELNAHGYGPFDSVLVQEYSNDSGIGYHADNEEIFKPEGAILTMSIRGSASFGLKCSAGECGFEHLECTSFVMPSGLQQTHKHRVFGTKGNRISLTFRMLRDSAYLSSDGSDNGLGSDHDEEDHADFTESSETFGVKLDLRKTHPLNAFKPIEVPADGDCFWHAVGYLIGLNGSEVKKAVAERSKVELKANAELTAQMGNKVFAENEAFAAACVLLDISITFIISDEGHSVIFNKEGSTLMLYIKLQNTHCSPLLPRNDCVIVAGASALSRPVKDVYKVLMRREHSLIFKQLCAGEGLSLMLLGQFFSIFDIHAYINFEGEHMEVNESGSLKRCFTVEQEHIAHNVKMGCSAIAPTMTGSNNAVSLKSLKVLKACGTELVYTVEEERARRLADSLHSGTTGAVCSSLFNGTPNLLQGLNPDWEARNVVAILGTFGSGKSTLFKDLFKRNPGKLICFVSPRRSLAQEIKESVFGKCTSPDGKFKIVRNKKNCNFNVCTFETFLKLAKGLKAGHTLVLDEIQLYPPGYLDLVACLVPRSCHLFVVGDPCQSNYDSEGDRSIFSGAASDIHKMLANAKYKFVTRSRRFFNKTFSGRLPCAMDDSKLVVSEEYFMARSFEEVRSFSKVFTEVFLVPGFDEKKIIKAHFPNCENILTFGESTGRTFEYGSILITQSGFSVCEQRWITALSRFSRNLLFLNLTEASFEAIAENMDDRALGKFFTQSASIDDLRKILPGEPHFADYYVPKLGKDHCVREDKLAGDPWLKTMVFLGQEEDVEKSEIEEAILAEPWFKTHLPLCEMESVRASWVQNFKAKENREVRKGYLVSDQFTDEHSKNRGKILTNAAERFEAIYPRHKNSDTVTFLMAVKKRLRFSKPMVECAKLNEARGYGKYLLDNFLKFVPLKAQHNPEFMARSVRDFEEKKTSKSAATIENHSGRSCRDWLADVGLIFMKSQICTKFDNRFRVAKAAQSIVCFQHSVLCRFAPYMRYIEMKLQEALPKNFYIHSGKGLEELNKWVLGGNFRGICTESDYEAFDASQDQHIVAFELACMEYLGLPKDLIADYCYIKTHLGSKLGSFAIMRFSGEASTFLFNTMANMLFTFLRYELTGKEFISFAGDDMCASKRLRVSVEHESFLGKLKLKAKVNFTTNPTFCGWCLTTDGIFKKPQLVFERLCIAKETNNLANCIDNYAIEISYAYKLGEAAVRHMSIEDMESYYNCVRIIIKNKHLLKSDVAKTFANGSS